MLRLKTKTKKYKTVNKLTTKALIATIYCCAMVLFTLNKMKYYKTGSYGKLIKEVEKSSCAIVGVRVKDTIKIADENKVVSKTPNRDYLWSIQTPQGFKLDIIKTAYQRAQQEGFLGTDDASLVERLNIAVKVVEGEYTNLKVTTPEDLKIIESLLNDEVYNV